MVILGSYTWRGSNSRESGVEEKGHVRDLDAIKEKKKGCVKPGGYPQVLGIWSKSYGRAENGGSIAVSDYNGKGAYKNNYLKR